LGSCTEQLSEYLPTEKFKTVFADTGQGIDYQPIDAIETEDGGYLILAEGSLNSVFILKIDGTGQLLWSKTMPATYENPVGDLVFHEGKYYFIAASSGDQTAALIEVDDFNQEVTPTQRSYPGYRQPLAFGKYDAENFLLLNYNDTIGPVLSKIQSGFAMEWARNFDLDGNQKELVNDALDKRDFNFLLGNINNGEILYFNSIRNEGKAFTYTDALGIETGKISSTSSGEVISYTYLGNLVSAINYSTGESRFFQIAHPLMEKDAISINQLAGNGLADFGVDGNAISVSTDIVATGQIINLYGTADNRVKWTNYTVGSESVNAVDYLGGQDPLRLVKAIETKDGGMLVLGAVLFGGSRTRIVVEKIPALSLKGVD
jgi:hypothetical protein